MKLQTVTTVCTSYSANKHGMRRCDDVCTLYILGLNETITGNIAIFLIFFMFSLPYILFLIILQHI